MCCHASCTAKRGSTEAASWTNLSLRQRAPSHLPLREYPRLSSQSISIPSSPNCNAASPAGASADLPFSAPESEPRLLSSAMSLSLVVPSASSARWLSCCRHRGLLSASDDCQQGKNNVSSHKEKTKSEEFSCGLEGAGRVPARKVYQGRIISPRLPTWIRLVPSFSKPPSSSSSATSAVTPIWGTHTVSLS